MEDKILEVKASRVLEVSKKCSETKKLMKILFPEAFAEKIYLTGTIFESLKTIDGKAVKLILAVAVSGQARLINLQDGYPYNLHTYKITNQTVIIPDEHLEGFKVVSIPEEKKVYKRTLKTPDDDEE